MAPQYSIEDEDKDPRNCIHASGDTTPEDTGTVSTGMVRKASNETLASSQSTAEVESLPSVNHPPPPYNTPENRSVAGDNTPTNIAHAETQLRTIQLHNITVPSPPITEAGDDSEGKAHLRTRVRSDVPLLQQLFKQPPRMAKRVRKVTKKAFAGPATPKPIENGDKKLEIPHFPEHSTWTGVAKEDITRGLQRLARAAHDKHEIDGSKSVEQHFSAELAEVIKQAEIQFDPSYLQ